MNEVQAMIKAAAREYNGCWLWDKRCESQGYAVVRFMGRHLKVHRLMFELVRGSIPNGLHLDHLCRNRNCVNPDHLEAVSHKENVLRGEGPTAINAKKTHCKRGHPLIPENLRNDPKGYRHCKVCDRIRTADHAQRKRDKIKHL